MEPPSCCRDFLLMVLRPKNVIRRIRFPSPFHTHRRVSSHRTSPRVLLAAERCTPPKLHVARHLMCREERCFRVEMSTLRCAGCSLAAIFLSEETFGWTCCVAASLVVPSHPHVIQCALLVRKRRGSVGTFTQALFGGNDRVAQNEPFGLCLHVNLRTVLRASPPVRRCDS